MSNTHEWFVEQRAAFVARSLDRRDEKAFVDHLVRCEDCTREVTRLERELGWLAMATAPAPPRPGLQRKLLEGALGVARWRWTRLTSVAVAASLLLAVGIYARDHRVQQQLRAELTRQEEALTRRAAALAAVQDTLSIMRDAAKVLQANFTMHGHTGGVLIFADQQSHRWNVVVHGLPPAGPGEMYQFWFIAPDGMIRAAEVHPNPSGPVLMTLGMPASGEQVLGAALSVEPMHEQSPGPRGQVLVHLTL